jgi:galactokinase
VSEPLRVHAPGRVNLIGDHTDYTGGLVLPMAIDRGTTLTFERRPGRVELASDASPDAVSFALPYEGDPREMRPEWGAYVAAMARELGTVVGIVGKLESDIPAGAGLSSSAALECAVGLALGFEGSATDLATLARRAEHAATGVPTGIMDQLCIAAATAGHATLIDCHTLAVTQVPVPDDIDVVIEFVAHRTLVGSAYADRVAQCARAETDIGPLRSATLADVASVADGVARRRARHVISENQRVLTAVDALAGGDMAEVGRLMVESHRSLRDDFATSTAQMDDAVDRLVATPGVYGARMTGDGFGGCVVAICRPGALDTGWRVSASPGVRYI